MAELEEVPLDLQLKYVQERLDQVRAGMRQLKADPQFRREVMHNPDFPRMLAHVEEHIEALEHEKASIVSLRKQQDAEIRIRNEMMLRAQLEREHKEREKTEAEAETNSNPIGAVLGNIGFRIYDPSPPDKSIVFQRRVQQDRRGAATLDRSDPVYEPDRPTLF
ncbi:hypothetical protein BSKO_02578 [Bryopsis sp. KO-2023]|nr:hypothetical protein BSKO_02578 [Bryopsis sp. KO-2023]